jgi:hypothetical protein
MGRRSTAGTVRDGILKNLVKAVAWTLSESNRMDLLFSDVADDSEHL